MLHAARAITTVTVLSLKANLQGSGRSVADQLNIAYADQALVAMAGTQCQ